MSDQQPSGKWVLVAGTGVIEASSLPVEVAWATAEVSRALAREGHSLITGDWPGVDQLAAQTYAAELRSLGLPVSPRLKQVISKDEPYERVAEGANVEREDTMFDANLRKLGLADFVVLIGGVGGTLKMFRGAQLVKKPALPVAGTGGDAEEAFRDTLEWWDERPVEGISREEFSKLGRSIKSAEDAREVAADLVTLIDIISGPPVTPREPVCLILTPDAEKFGPVRLAVAEALKGAGVLPVTRDSAAGLRLHGTKRPGGWIERADLIIADITGGDPNVMYELGLAHALRKPVLYIAEQAAGQTPNALGGLEYYVYDPAKAPSELTPEILKWVELNKSSRE